MWLQCFRDAQRPTPKPDCSSATPVFLLTQPFLWLQGNGVGEVTEVNIKQAKLGIFSLDEFPHLIVSWLLTMEQGSDLPPSAAVAAAGLVSSQAQPGAAHPSRHSLTC